MKYILEILIFSIIKFRYSKSAYEIIYYYQDWYC